MGGEPAPGVLDHHHVAARDKELVIAEVANELLSVGKTKQQYGKLIFVTVCWKSKKALR